MRWCEVRTGKQKRILLNAILEELKKLKKSPCLKDLLKNMEISNSQVYITKNGEIITYYKWGDGDIQEITCNEITLKGKELERYLEERKILPGDIERIREEIEKTA